MSYTVNSALRTAAPSALVSAELACWAPGERLRATLWNAAGGPLDAPESMPAGSCNSTDVTGGMRLVHLAAQTDIKRGAS